MGRCDEGKLMTHFTLGTCLTADGPKAALGIEGQYHLLEDAHPRLAQENCRSLLDKWEEAFLLLEEAAELLSDRGAEHGHATSGREVHLLAPVLYPDKLLAVGANYSGHVKEVGLETSRWPSLPFFLRPPTTTLVGPGKTVRIPRSTRQFDWECELAVIVGKPLRHARREEAAAAIAGFAIGLDLSCRDLINGDNHFIDLVRGKAQDTLAPCGPAITPSKFVSDVNSLRIQLFVNDEKMMDASTAQMIHKVDEQLSVISEFISLAPGDILFTGSPPGTASAHGNRWLRHGDRIRAEIEQLGVLEVELQMD
jgi:2,4-didehydro-3-deoxy-L-rhamnonate hydrolase